MHPNEVIKLLEALKQQVADSMKLVRDDVERKEERLQWTIDVLIKNLEVQVDEELKEIEAQSRKEGIFNAASGT